MNDEACIEFLQWALPRLEMRWDGFRKVRHQVCKRINRRLQTLQLGDIAAYQGYLLQHREEWPVLDGLCRVSISRFFRDRLVFSRLQSVVLPELLQRARVRERAQLRLWSAGCAAGEEPYSLSILWEQAMRKPAVGGKATVEIIATDSDQRLLDRAGVACYPYSSVKSLAEEWRGSAFAQYDGEYCLCPLFRRNVSFLCQDLRTESPSGLFDLILCRNLAFTYFDEGLQRRVLGRLARALQPEGCLVVGIHESLPKDYDEFAPRFQRLGIYQRRLSATI